MRWLSHGKSCPKLPSTDSMSPSRNIAGRLTPFNSFMRLFFQTRRPFRLLRRPYSLDAAPWLLLISPLFHRGPAFTECPPRSAFCYTPQDLFLKPLPSPPSQHGLGNFVFWFHRLFRSILHCFSNTFPMLCHPCRHGIGYTD